MKKLSNWSNILGSQKMSVDKIEDFLFFYLVCKIHINIACNPFIGQDYTSVHTIKLRHKLKFI